MPPVGKLTNSKIFLQFTAVNFQKNQQTLVKIGKNFDKYQ